MGLVSGKVALVTGAGQGLAVLLRLNLQTKAPRLLYPM